MFKIGFAYDSHRFEEGRKFILGGVQIPYEKGLKGHSDADVLLHAVIDALLGALGESDIGTLFPDTDARFKDASSIALLSEVVKIMKEKGFLLANVDTTVICERPKLKEYIPKMRENIANVFDSPYENVTVKAKTNEKMDAVGEGRGVSAYAVLMLLKKM